MKGITIMYYFNFAEDMNYLLLKRYLLICEFAEHGPYYEEEVFYNPDDFDPVIEQYDLIEAIEEIDQQILDLIAKASKEDWYYKHKHKIRMETSKYEDRKTLYETYGLTGFPF